MMDQKWTVFSLTPVLTNIQRTEPVEKFNGIHSAGGAGLINEENWGLKKLA